MRKVLTVALSVRQRRIGCQNVPAAVLQVPDAKGEARQTTPALLQPDWRQFGSARPELAPHLVRLI